MSDEEIEEMAHQVAALRKELYESAGRNRSYHVKAEDMKNLLPDWAGADGCIATNRITVEGCKVGYCYREEPDGDWDSGWRFTAGDESDDYMDDPNNAGLYKLNTICNDDSDIIPLLNTPAPAPLSGMSMACSSRLKIGNQKMRRNRIWTFYSSARSGMKTTNTRRSLTRWRPFPPRNALLRWTVSWPGLITIWQTQISQAARICSKGDCFAEAP
ncbi:DUF2185 domain-containing protein [Flavonifractor plautii]|nr:DUF2185 domain-containing protein [Flavonifractor plautii]